MIQTVIPMKINGLLSGKDVIGLANVVKSNPAVPVQKKSKAVSKTTGKGKAEAKKGITPLRAVLIETTFILLLATIFLSFLFFDYGGARDSVLTFLQAGEHPYQNQMNALNALQDQIRQDKAGLSLAQEEFAAQEKLLEKQRRDLEAREAAILQRTEEIDLRQEALDGNTVNLDKLVSIYEKMDASTAAKIMEEMADVDEATRILSRMKDATVADIMAAMSREFAAKVSINLAP